MVDYQYGGVCGKKNDTALQDKLTGALIGLARVTDGNEHLISPSSTAVIVESLFVLAHPNPDPAVLTRLLTRVVEQKRSMAPNCFSCASPCGKNSDYNMSTLHTAQEDIRSLKYSILQIIYEIAACAYPAAALGYHDSVADSFFYKALIVIGMDDYEAKDLMPILLEADEVKLVCMALQEKTNTKFSGDF